MAPGDCAIEPREDERGLALLVVLMATTLLLALGGGLVALTTTEARIAATFRDGLAALYGCDAAIARALRDLAASGDWSAVLDGSDTSSFVDGPGGGVRIGAGGVPIDLDEATNLERCAMRTCTVADMNAVTIERPWGQNNPRWQLYGYGPLSSLVPAGTDHAGVYVVLWVGDDALEVDGDPTRDAANGAPGHDVLTLRVAAYAQHGARRQVEATVSRTGTGLRVRFWRELK